MVCPLKKLLAGDSQPPSLNTASLQKAGKVCQQLCALQKGVQVASAIKCSAEATAGLGRPLVSGVHHCMAARDKEVPETCSRTSLACCRGQALHSGVPRDSTQTSRTTTSRKAVAIRKAQAKGAHTTTSTTWHHWAQSPALQPPALQPACSAIALHVTIDATMAAGSRESRHVGDSTGTRAAKLVSGQRGSTASSSGATMMPPVCLLSRNV